MDKGMKRLLRSQKAARSNAKIYRQMAKETGNKKLKKALTALAKDDKKTANALKGIAGMKAKPNFIMVRLKKELYKGLNMQNLYLLTYWKRRINEKRYAAMADAQAPVIKAAPKLKEKLQASALVSGEHLAKMKKII